MIRRLEMRSVFLALTLVLGLTVAADATDYAGSISAYRRANRMPAVTLDAKLNAMALKQAQAMSATGSVSHSAGGSFFRSSVPLKTSGPASSPSPRC